MTNHPAALPPHCGHAHSLAVTTPPPAMSRMLLGLKVWLTFALKSPGVGISPRPVVCDNHQVILLPHCGHATHSLQQWPRLPLPWHVYCWDCRSGRTFVLKSPGTGVSLKPVACDNHKATLPPHCGHAHSLQQWPHLPLPWHVYCLDCRSGRTFALKSPGTGVSLKPLACYNHPDPPPHSGHAQSLRQWPRLPVSCHVYC